MICSIASFVITKLLWLQHYAIAEDCTQRQISQKEAIAKNGVRIESRNKEGLAFFAKKVQTERNYNSSYN